VKMRYLEFFYPRFCGITEMVVIRRVDAVVLIYRSQRCGSGQFVSGRQVGS
jgi:hypothetical protein